MSEFLSTYSWIVWLCLILIFITIEVATVHLIFLMLAVGSIGGLVMNLIGLPYWSQIVGAAIISLILIFFVRPLLRRALQSGRDNSPTNVAGLLGLSGTVATGFAGHELQVRLANGETWTARLGDAEASAPLRAGDRVIVTAIEGATAVVVPGVIEPGVIEPAVIEPAVIEPPERTQP